MMDCPASHPAFIIVTFPRLVVCARHTYSPIHTHDPFPPFVHFSLQILASVVGNPRKVVKMPPTAAQNQAIQQFVDFTSASSRQAASVSGESGALLFALLAALRVCGRAEANAWLRVCAR